jgi:hypothetical protein
MKNLLLTIILLPSLAHAGYFFNGRCFTDPDQVFNAYYQTPIQHHYQSAQYPDSDYYILLTDFNNTTTNPSVTNCTVLSKPYCITGPFSFSKTSLTYYNLITKNRFRFYDTAGVPTLLNSYPNYIRLQECNPENQPFGVEPVNLSVTYPPDTFNPSNINPVDAASSIGSGFLLIAVPLAVVWAGRHFIKPLFNA